MSIVRLDVGGLEALAAAAAAATSSSKSRAHPLGVGPASMLISLPRTWTVDAREGRLDQAEELVALAEQRPS